jgi:hypothetical protein
METTVMNAKMRAIAAGRTANVHQEGLGKHWVIVALMWLCEEQINLFQWTAEIVLRVDRHQQQLQPRDSWNGHEK